MGGSGSAKDGPDDRADGRSGDTQKKRDNHAWEAASKHNEGQGQADTWCYVPTNRAPSKSGAAGSHKPEEWKGTWAAWAGKGVENDEPAASEIGKSKGAKDSLPGAFPGENHPVPDDPYDTSKRNWDVTGTVYDPKLTDEQVAKLETSQIPETQKDATVSSQALKDDFKAVRSYWTAWNRQAMTQAQDEPSGPQRSKGIFVADEEALYAVPKDIAEQTLASHQVRPGRAAVYVHQLRKPLYLDTLDSPYAVFVFKYRSRGERNGLMRV
jgi:hypothetical protein